MQSRHRRRNTLTRLLSLACITGALTASAAERGSELKSLAEQTGYQRTGRYEEVERLCRGFQQTWPGKVRCAEFGRTPEGRPMLALVASQDGVLDPAAAPGGRAQQVAPGGADAGRHSRR
jgi:hypothetical protein